METCANHTGSWRKRKGVGRVSADDRCCSSDATFVCVFVYRLRNQINKKTLVTLCKLSVNLLGFDAFQFAVELGRYLDKNLVMETTELNFV